MLQKLKYIRGSYSVYTLPGSCQKIAFGRYGQAGFGAYCESVDNHEGGLCGERGDW
jgi:hypothetical protein